MNSIKNIFSSKSNLAIILSINDNYAFAASNVIQRIEFYDHGLVDKYIIFHDHLSQNNIIALKALTKKIDFRIYDISSFLKKCPNFSKDTPSIARWTHLIFAKFEIFKLTENFKNCIFFDADLHPLTSIKQILTYRPFAWRPAAPSLTERTKNYENIPQHFTMPNAGLIYVSDSIKDCSKYTNICYTILNDSFGKISTSQGQDEIVFGVLNYKYNLNANHLPMIWNCPLGGKQTDKAKILHFMGRLKIWKNPILLQMFPEFKNNLQRHIDLGGTFNKNDVSLGDGFFSKNFTLLDSYNTIKNILLWKELLGDFYLKLNSNCVMSQETSKQYIQFYIKGFNKEIHYEIIQIKDKPYHKIIGFHIEDQKIIKDKISSLNIMKNISNKLGFIFKVTNKKLIIERTVKDTNLLESFSRFIENTIFIFANILRNRSN
ncbi:MAG: hypothetical protein IKO41_00885 [Lachnospiraceae bacterium]|nr:hypothetical protein [Lachnospiraceae bacterium]